MSESLCGVLELVPGLGMSLWSLSDSVGFEGVGTFSAGQRSMWQERSLNGDTCAGSFRSC